MLGTYKDADVRPRCVWAPALLLALHAPRDRARRSSPQCGYSLERFF